MTITDVQQPAIESQIIVNDGKHNAFTDLVAWQGLLWLAYRTSSSHFASKRSQIVLLRSTEGLFWEEAARMDGHGEDIRDPKLAVIVGRLTLFALLNHSFDPQPYQTVYTSSDDGLAWHPFAPALPAGWLLGKPKCNSQGDWYAPAHHLGFSEVKMFRLTERGGWHPHATITSLRGADECAIEFLADGSLLAAIRLEAGSSIFGHSQAGTLFSIAYPPYQSWACQRIDHLTRLDSPSLFSIRGQVHAIGRFQPRKTPPFQSSGSVLSRKRTAIFQVNENGMEWRVNLPSAGDTAYAGVAEWGNKLYISYYTSPPERDNPWLAGMVAPTSIRIAIIEGAL